jgi:hypothetical protein
MPDDKKIKKPLDTKRVNINDPHEINYWCDIWSCPEKELKAAVKKVGTSADAVKKHLGK